MSFSNDFNGQKQTQSSMQGSGGASDADAALKQNVDAIERNTKTVTDAVLLQKQRGGSGSKIILGMGELHENGLHIVQQISILDALKKSGLNCATALEWPANNIDLHIKEIFKQSTTDKNGLIGMLEAEENSTLRNRLSADTTPVRSANARLSRALMHEFMDDHGIAAFCTDAPRDWELFIRNSRRFQHLLTADPEVAEAVHDAMALLNMPDDPTSVPPIDSLKQLGMLARNIYILDEAERVLDAHPDIDVILIEAGRAHVTGNDALKPEPSPYEHSMSSLVAKRSKYSFIGAPLYSSQGEKEKNTTPQALIDPQILSLDYLGKAPFNTNSSTTSDINEAEQLRVLGKHLSFIRDTLRGRTPRGLYDERKEELRTDLRELRDRHGFTLGKPDDYTPI